MAPLAALLAVEHAAVYAYGEAGGIVAAAGPAGTRAMPLVRDGFDAHRRGRDRLTEEILARGGTPPAAQPAYR
ncbi:MAG TPA: DUF4439 domain-containing protein, partial [Frankiaceae bacterium]|nr:DUF4439 domain-containing protein [Frankiaceae bacterium]